MMTAREHMKRKEEEALKQLQDPIQAGAEFFIKELLLPRFRVPELKTKEKAYYGSVRIYENDCPYGYTFEMISEAVNLADEYGLKGEKSKNCCIFSKPC